MTYKIHAHELVNIDNGATAISLRLAGPSGHWAQYTMTHEDAANYPVGSTMTLTPGKGKEA